MYRWSFPFKNIEIARLYLKTAEIVCKDICGIYEIVNNKGRKLYKIFPTRKELNDYLKKNSEKLCTSMNPLYISEKYSPINEKQIRRLSSDEVYRYLEEQKCNT